MEITGGRGVDVVYDSVGKDTIARSLRCLRKRGLCVMFGASSGQVSAIAPLELAEAGSVFFTRPHLADYLADQAEIDLRAQALFRLHAEGKLVVTVHDALRLEEAAAAHRILESRGTLGKILLHVSA
jgi:NADPH2:quinone reductase